MNLSLPEITSSPLSLTVEEDSARARQFRSLVSLFALYAAALLAVLVVPDGEDIGCILAGIAGHVIYASVKLRSSWRDASWLAVVRVRVRRRYA